MHSWTQNFAGAMRIRLSSLRADKCNERAAQKVTSCEKEQARLIAEMVRFEPAYVVVAEVAGEICQHVNESNRHGGSRRR